MAQWILQGLLRDIQMFDIQFDITTFTGFTSIEEGTFLLVQTLDINFHCVYKHWT